MNIRLWDKSKVGTLIVGQFRTGTHFLEKVVAESFQESVLRPDEICTNNQIDQFVELSQHSPTYKVAILNNFTPKFYLTDNELLSKWHVIHLTRTDLVGHFISDWFWRLHDGQRRYHVPEIRHHNTDYAAYRSNMSDPVEYDINLVIFWLQEQLINYHVPADIRIDYNELASLETDKAKWMPNSYGDIKLEDLVTNHAEIYTLLKNFKFKND